MSEIAVIVNAGAGAGGGEAAAEAIGAKLVARGVAATVSAVRGREIPAAVRRALERGATVVAAGGGDGTVSGVAAGVVGTKAALGVVPLGTLNHFAKDLGIPADLDAALETLVAGHTVLVDVGEANGHIFVNNSSLGLYPRLVWERERQRRQGRRKWLAFVHALGHVWAHYRRLTVVVTSEGTSRLVHTPFLFVGNNEYHTQGLQMGGRSGADQGVLHLCLAPGMSRFEVVRVLLAALVGRIHEVPRFESMLVDAVTIKVRRRRLGVAFDGELAVLSTPIRYRIRPRALRVVVPKPVPAPALAEGA